MDSARLRGARLLAAGAALAIAAAVAVPGAAGGSTTAAAVPTISTAVGNGYRAYCGTHAPTETCMVSNGVAVAPGGAIFISDYANQVVWRLLGGALTIYAGAIEQDGKCKDGSVATQACLNQPAGLAVDATGNLYIAEGRGGRVDRVDTSGHIAKYAGGNFGAPEHFCGDGGAATAACLQKPQSLLFTAAGDLLIADAGNNRVRSVDPAGTITTIAGNGRRGYCGDDIPAVEACVYGPDGLAQDGAGNIDIAEGNGNRVVRVDPAGTITTVAGNGTTGDCGDGGKATQACLGFASGVAVDASGALFISTESRIRRVDPNTLKITALAGNGIPADCADGPAPTALCMSPGALVARPDGSLLIVDAFRLRSLAGGAVTTIAGRGDGCGDGGPATEVCAGPSDITFGLHGALYFTDGWRIRKVDASGTVTTVLGGGHGPDCESAGVAALQACPIIEPFGITVDKLGQLYYVDLGEIRKVDTAGQVAIVGGEGTAHHCNDDDIPAIGACISSSSMTADGAGNLVLTTYPGKLREIRSDGTIITLAGGGKGAGCDLDGVAVLDACLGTTNHVVRVSDGFLLSSTINGSNRVRKVSGGVVTTVLGGDDGPSCGNDGRLALRSCLVDQVEGLAVGANGRLFFSTLDNRVRVVQPNGRVRTFAGNGTYAFCGDGGPALDACFATPGAVAVGPGRTLFVTDYQNHRIREVS